MECRVTRGLSIVVVEEPSLSRNVLLKALHEWGYPCLVAEDEESAWVSVLGAQTPALVLADWHASFLECDELFERIRARRALQGVYLMGAVPRGAVGAIRRCLGSGADDFLYHPYDLDEVRVRLHIASKVLGVSTSGPVFG